MNKWLMLTHKEVHMQVCGVSLLSVLWYVLMARTAPLQFSIYVHALSG